MNTDSNRHDGLAVAVGSATCPVCGKQTSVSVFGPWFTPEPTYRFAMECPVRHWRGRMCSTRVEAESPKAPSSATDGRP